MKKTKELPFFESYGFDGETQFRYFFLHEEAKALEDYKKQIIKCLKYDVLYHINPEHKTGHETYDALRPSPQLPVQLDYKTFGRVFGESVRGAHKGELVVTYTLSDDRKSMDLTLYDRDISVQRVTIGDEDGPIEYAIVDNIIESKVRLTKGKKISVNDIEVYRSPRKIAFDKKSHDYESAMKVITAVKEKTDYNEFTDKVVDENKQDKKENIKKGI
jgi:hypothetical protein